MPDIMPLIEIVEGEETSAETLEITESRLADDASLAENIYSLKKGKARSKNRKKMEFWQTFEAKVNLYSGYILFPIPFTKES